MLQNKKQVILSILNVVAAVSGYCLFISIENNDMPNVRIIQLKTFEAHV